MVPLQWVFLMVNNKILAFLKHTWFLKIDPVQIVGMRVCMCVCPRPRLLIISSMIWTSYNWLKKFYSCYMATVDFIINERGLGIDTCHGN